ncbi:MAG: type I restriction enzyme HsdR N-terminal domain-containing protein [Burkholderiales bacterium]|nr:type I restriction enzyme HsdR N-terminal domain-containing protein [Burkholderiales bacterium]
MDLIDKIKELSSRIQKQKDHIKTEEATKNAFVMPFISALGYDVFNPMEVIPEFTADAGIKKGEKVDYAIKKDNGIIILIECKWAGANLQNEHSSQLYRYFSVTEARFAILTNGIEYYFYSDIDEPNRMDSKPFFEFNILHFEDHQINELKKFTKSAFSLNDILTTASTLKYTSAIKKILDEELKNPTEPFVRFFASQIYDGRLTQQVIEQFTQIVKNARNQFINERLNERLKSALAANEGDSSIDSNAMNSPNETSATEKNEIETTQEEIDGFNIVKAILREDVDVSRIAMRDNKSYCAVLLDDNNRKPVCRLHFNFSQKYLGVFTNKNEERLPITKVDDIFKHAGRLKTTIKEYES